MVAYGSYHTIIMVAMSIMGLLNSGIMNDFSWDYEYVNMRSMVLDYESQHLPQNHPIL